MKVSFFLPFSIISVGIATSAIEGGILATKIALQKRGVIGAAFCIVGLPLFQSCSFNTQTDVANCGRVNNVCAPFPGSNGVGLCNGGVCGGVCPPGLVFNLACKACLNLNSDINNCGYAGNQCTQYAQATTTCQQGVCRGVCNSGLKFSSAQNKCVPVSSNDPLNCAAPGNVCQAIPNSYASCLNSVCSSVCLPGYVFSGNACISTVSNDPNNCRFPGDRCPNVPGGTATCSNNVCGFNCGPGFMPSGSFCVPVNSNDPNNCAGPGQACPIPNNGLAICTNRVCGIVCNYGFHGEGPCESASDSFQKLQMIIHSNVCIADARNDPNNCVAPGVPCPIPQNSVATCNNAVCGFICRSGFYQAGQYCISQSSSDINNCAFPGNQCAVYVNGSTFCINSVCSATCNPGFKYNQYTNLCDSTTIGTIQNCAYIGNQCATYPNSISTCINNACGASCITGFHYDVQLQLCVANGGGGNDPSACGPASINCPSYPNSQRTCTNGVCGAFCNPGYDYNPQQQLCLPSGPNYKTDINNCGRQGNVCPVYANAGTFCLAGQCGASCNFGFLFSNLGNVCVFTSNLIDPNNCGTNGKVCPAQQACSNGICVQYCGNVVGLFDKTGSNDFSTVGIPPTLMPIAASEVNATESTSMRPTTSNSTAVAPLPIPVIKVASAQAKDPQADSSSTIPLLDV